MDASHILLGRPWQFDVDVRFKGQDNTFVFMWEPHKIAMAPTSQQAVFKPPKVEGQSFVTIASSEAEFVKEVKSSQEVYAMMVKGVVIEDIEK